MLCNQLSVEHCALPRFPVSKEDFHDCSLLMLVIELLKFLQFFGTQEAIEVRKIKEEKVVCSVT